MNEDLIIDTLYTRYKNKYGNALVYVGVEGGEITIGLSFLHYEQSFRFPLENRPDGLEWIDNLLPSLDDVISRIKQVNSFPHICGSYTLENCSPPTDVILKITTRGDINNIIYPVAYTNIGLSPNNLRGFPVFINENHEIIKHEDVYSWALMPLTEEYVKGCLFNKG